MPQMRRHEQFVSLINGIINRSSLQRLSTNVLLSASIQDKIQPRTTPVIIFQFMGNNHDKYFGSDKRKIVILGLQKAGKTALLQYIKTQKVNFQTERTKNLNIEDVKIGTLQVTFFDLSGGERQRVFWKQQYDGTQGLLFVFDVTFTQEQKSKSLEELDKLFKQFDNKIPFAVVLSKIDLVSTIEWNQYKLDLAKTLAGKYRERPLLKVFEVDYKNKDSIKNMLSWLLHETKPI